MFLNSKKDILLMERNKQVESIIVGDQLDCDENFPTLLKKIHGLIELSINENICYFMNCGLIFDKLKTLVLVNGDVLKIKLFLEQCDINKVFPNLETLEYKSQEHHNISIRSLPSSLKMLNLHGNFVSSFEFLKNLKKLEYLDIYYSFTYEKEIQIMQTYFLPQTLKTLIISNEYFKSNFEQIELLTNLRDLQIYSFKSGFVLSKVDFLKMPFLENLVIYCHNTSTDGKNYFSLKSNSIVNLCYSNNLFSDCFTYFKNICLPKLEKLYLAGVKTEFSSINLPSLKEISFFRSEVDDSKFFETCPNLEKIKIVDTKLVIDRRLYLPKLQVFDLKDKLDLFKIINTKFLTDNKLLKFTSLKFSKDDLDIEEYCYEKIRKLNKKFSNNICYINAQT